MWQRLLRRLRHHGVALVTAMVFAIAVVDRRASLPLSVPPIVLRLDPLSFSPSGRAPSFAPDFPRYRLN
jgi:hypothetical protein